MRQRALEIYQLEPDEKNGGDVVIIAEDKYHPQRVDLGMVRISINDVQAVINTLEKILEAEREYNGEN